jgi:translation initiation factor 2 alpha subunit (eIF-2alpha)
MKLLKSIVVAVCLALSIYGQSGKPTNKNRIVIGQTVATVAAMQIDITTKFVEQWRKRKWRDEYREAHRAEVLIRFDNRKVEMSFDEFLRRVGFEPQLEATPGIQATK